jgi:glycine C-acetyltransferase
MLRLIPTAIHTLEDVKYTIDTFKIIKQQLTAGKYSMGGVPEVGEAF